MNLTEFFNFIHPYSHYLFALLIIISFLRSIPILGLILTRVPILAVVCITASSVYEIVLAIICSYIPELLGDALNYNILNKFWSKYLYKAHHPFIEPKIDAIFKHYKKRPIISSLIVSYTMFNFSLLMPIAKKYDLKGLFWYPRIIIGFFNTIIFASFYYIVGYNLKLISSIFGNFSIIIIVLIVVIIIYNLYKSISIIKRFFSKDSK